MTDEVHDQREALYAADPKSFGRDGDFGPKKKMDEDFRRERCGYCFHLNHNFGRTGCEFELPYPAQPLACPDYRPTKQIPSIDRSGGTVPFPVDLAGEYERHYNALVDLCRRAHQRRSA